MFLAFKLYAPRSVACSFVNKPDIYSFNNNFLLCLFTESPIRRPKCWHAKYLVLYGMFDSPGGGLRYYVHWPNKN
jgi:hypothetical protein